MTVAEAVARPQLGQLPLLLEHEWIAFEPVLAGEAFLFSSQEQAESFVARLQHPAPDVGDGWYEAAVVVHPTAAFREGRLLAPERGRELFARLAEVPELRLIRIDTRYSVLGGFVHEALEGRDPRPGASVLRARSIAEIHLYLDFNGAHEREHELVYVDGELLARYGDFYFYPVDSALAMGPGPTEILCGGLLAFHVRFKGDNAADFPPEIRERWKMWADEALKLVDPATDAIPREAIRTTYAESSLLRMHPDLLSGERLREARGRL